MQKNYISKKQQKITIKNVVNATLKKIDLPLSIWLTGSTEVLVRKDTLRVLPGKRWVVNAAWGEHEVVAKIFTNIKHAQRELRGLKVLATTPVNMPKLLHHGWAAQQGFYVLIFEKIIETQDVNQLWWNGNKSQRDNILHRLILLLAQMHQCGIKQNDLHLKNFVLSQDKLYVLDAADITKTYHDRPLNISDSLKNMALLLAQVAPAYDQECERWYLDYVKQRHIIFTIRDVGRLQKWVKFWRAKHFKFYAKKVFRTTSQLASHSTWRKFSVYDRHYDSLELQDLLQDPEKYLQAGEVLKDGNTCTVVRVKTGEHDWVVKRYNIKGFWHGVKRALQTSRAAICWRSVMLLKSLRLSVVTPVAMLEKRIGPLRSTAYFIMQYEEGISLQDFAATVELTAPQLPIVAHRVACLFDDLQALKISHGDLKASNILLTEDGPKLLDLDAMRFHHCNFSWKKAKLKDEKRFAKNWYDRPELQKVFSKSQRNK